MSNSRQLTIQDLKESDNKQVQKLKKNDWISRFDKETEGMEEGLIMDLSRSSCLINGKSLVNELEKHPKSADKITAIRNKVNKEYFNADKVTSDANFDEKFDHLHKSWGYVANVLREVILSSIHAENDKLHVNMEHESDIKLEKPKIYVDVTYFNINIVDTNTKNLEKTPLPGKVTSRFLLSDNGFKLESVTVSPGTSLLSDLCMKEKMSLNHQTTPTKHKEESASNSWFSLHHIMPSTAIAHNLLKKWSFWAVDNNPPNPINDQKPDATLDTTKKIRANKKGTPKSAFSQKQKVTLVIAAETESLLLSCSNECGLDDQFRVLSLEQPDLQPACR